MRRVELVFFVGFWGVFSTLHPKISKWDLVVPNRCERVWVLWREVPAIGERGLWIIGTRMRMIMYVDLGLWFLTLVFGSNDRGVGFNFGMFWLEMVGWGGFYVVVVRGGERVPVHLERFCAQWTRLRMRFWDLGIWDGWFQVSKWEWSAARFLESFCTGSYFLEWLILNSCWHYNWQVEEVIRIESELLAVDSRQGYLRWLISDIQ